MDLPVTRRSFVGSKGMFVWAALGVALIDWSAVYLGRARLEALAKPLVLISLIVAVVDAGPTSIGWLVVGGLALSLAGDILLLPAVDRFLTGLAAFLAAHIVYVVAFVAEWTIGEPQARVLLAVGCALALVLWGLIGRRIISASEGAGANMRKAVQVYVLILSAMMIAGFGVGSALLALGALLFALSDGVLGWNRFVAPMIHGRLATHVLYHLGQILIAAWAVNLI